MMHVEQALQVGVDPSPNWEGHTQVTPGQGSDVCMAGIFLFVPQMLCSPPAPILRLNSYPCSSSSFSYCRCTAA